MSKIDITACPWCGIVGRLAITIELVANPIGSYSLSGQQFKVTARERPVLRCDSCKRTLLGDFTADQTHVVFPDPKKG